MNLIHSKYCTFRWNFDFLFSIYNISLYIAPYSHDFILTPCRTYNQIPKTYKRVNSFTYLQIYVDIKKLKLKFLLPSFPCNWKFSPTGTSFLYIYNSPSVLGSVQPSLIKKPHDSTSWWTTLFFSMCTGFLPTGINVTLINCYTKHLIT